MSYFDSCLLISKIVIAKISLYSKFSPKNGGKRCEGEEREYKLCNTGVSSYQFKIQGT